MTINVLGLCEGGELKVQMFNFVQMLIRIPMLKFSTNAPLLQNPCACCTTKNTKNKFCKYPEIKHYNYLIVSVLFVN